MSNRYERRLTSRQWSRIYPEYRILNPHGWPDYKIGPEPLGYFFKTSLSWNTERITEVEYTTRLAYSDVENTNIPSQSWRRESPLVNRS